MSAVIRRPLTFSRFRPKNTPDFKRTLIGIKSQNGLLSLNKRQFSNDQTQTPSSSQTSQSSAQQSSEASSNVEIETPQTQAIDQSQYGNRTRRSHRHRRGDHWMMPFGSSLFPSSFFDTPTTRLFDRFTKEMMSPLMRFPPFDWVNDINRQLTSEGLSSSINVDIIEHHDKYIIKASLPGINKENVKVNIDRDNENNQYLTIKAEKKHDVQNEDKDKKYLYSESTYGLVERKVILPEDIDLENGIDAKLENGELKMEIQKNEQKKKQTHEVKIQ